MTHKGSEKNVRISFLCIISNHRKFFQKNTNLCRDMAQVTLRFAG